ncbi:MAG: hypothetical protein ACREDY_13990, partial [Bradyrhizobium sp.]
ISPMPDPIAGPFASRQTAWLVAAGLGIALAVSIVFDLRGEAPVVPKDRSDYDRTAESMAAANGAQSLRFRLEGQYAGPLRDTTIQRWRDPVDGTVCYIYLPIAVPHSAGPPGLVQYGQADIGSISCVPRAR